MIRIVKKTIEFLITYVNKRSLKGSVYSRGVPKINGRIVVRNSGGEISFGDSVVINSRYTANPVGGGNCTGFFLKPGARLLIGDNVGMSNVTIYVWEEIIIGNNVLIGGGAQIYDTDFHSLGYEDRVLKGDNKVAVKPVKICEGVFVGANSTILKGVTIGARSIIGAGSIVTKDIPPDEIWAGNPAKFIKEIKL